MPKRLWDRPLLFGLWYWAQDFVVCGVFFYAALNFDLLSDAFASLAAGETSGLAYTTARYSLRTSLWLLYWWWAGLEVAGIWFNGHEASHGSLTEYNWINDCLGLISHMTILNPFFAWKVSHKLHHKGSGHVEREDSYVPIFRKMYIEDNPRAASKLLPLTPSDHRLVVEQAKERERRTGSKYSMIYDAVDDTPMYVLLMRFVASITAGLNGYMMFNVGGNRTHRPGANHFLPNSPLFKPHHAAFIILSDVAVLCAAYVLYDLGRIYGYWNLFVFYGIPYVIGNFVLTWVTLLQHSDATVPHYRGKDWNFFKGALATIDRDFFGWQGKFFVHGAAQHHTAHHLFPDMPNPSTGEATKILAPLLGDHYCYDDTPPLWALWRTYHECQFLEDGDGDTLFFRDRVGKARRGLGEDDLPPSAMKGSSASTTAAGGMRSRKPHVE